MKSIRGIVLIMALSLILTGCFRQASEPFESVDNAEQSEALQNVPEESPVPPLSTATEVIEQVVTTEPQATNTVAPLPTEAIATETIPTEDGAVEQQDSTDTDLPTIAPPVTSTPIIAATNTVAAVIQPSNTPAPVQPTATSVDTTQNQNENTNNITPTFITPGAVSGQNQITPTANNTTPSANTDNVGASSTPSGLITPTDFLNPQNLPEQCYYIVQSGDNLFRIAVNNSVTLDQLRIANPQIQSDIIQPGDQLIIPLPNCDGDTVPEIEPTVESTPAAPTGQTIHTVSSGETLGQIARRYGTTIDAIVSTNNLTNPDRLSIGQQIIIPSQ